MTPWPLRDGMGLKAELCIGPSFLKTEVMFPRYQNSFQRVIGAHPTRFKVKMKNHKISVMVEKSCHVIRVEDCELQSSEVAELSSNKEEEDTKVFLGCKHAEIMRHRHACIVTVDSDVAINAIHFAS